MMVTTKIQAEADRLHIHARSCKKAPDECRMCRAIIAWFGALPPQVLSDVLAEKGYVAQASRTEWQEQDTHVSGQRP